MLTMGWEPFREAWILLAASVASAARLPRSRSIWPVAERMKRRNTVMMLWKSMLMSRVKGVDAILKLSIAVWIVCKLW